MAAFGLCLSAIFTCLIASTLIEARSLRLRHGHHSHPDYNDFEPKSMPKDLSSHHRHDEERDVDPEYSDRQTERWRDYPVVEDRFANSEYEDVAEERVPAAHHRRFRHEHGAKTYEPLRRGNEESYEEDYERYASPKFVARRKRQNNRHGSLIYRAITDEDRRDIRTNKRRNYDTEFLYADDLPYEMEVKEAQNSTVCNYTVMSIPDTKGSRVPRDLEHVKCNHAGSTCQGGKHCCIQTYRRTEVFYGDGTTENMKIYVGCVCGRLRGLEESILSTND